MDDFNILLLPGLGGSGVEHWQSRWQNAFSGARTVEQEDWDQPEFETWIAALNNTIEASHKPVVLVAHSLACALVAHWAERYPRGRTAEPSTPVAAAMLVAPADVDSEEHTPEVVRPFAPMPLGRLPFPSTVVASTNDPHVTADRSAYFAGNWGSEYVSLGPMAHISDDSGLGAWPHGQAILNELVGSLPARQKDPAGLATFVGGGAL